MNKTFNILLGIIFLYSNTSCQETNSIIRSNERSYSERLLIVLESIKNNQNVEAAAIAQILPRSQNEYIYFYSMTYPEIDDSLKKTFYLFNNKVDSLIKDENEVVFRNYLLMSEFVDGEYAESYFDNLNFYMQSNEKYCSIVVELSCKIARLKKVENFNLCETPR